MYIRVVANIAFRSYIKIMWRLSYITNPGIIWAFIVVPVMGFLLCISNNIYSPDKLKVFLFSLSMSFIWPVIIYFIAKWNYYSKGRYTGPIVFEITEEKMTVTATSRNISYRWDEKAYFIREFNNWIVLYKIVNRTKFPVEVIPKEVFTPEQVYEIKQMVLPPSHIERKWWLIPLIIFIITLLLNILFLFW